ncbi:MAG: TetR family transcriptional regulator [Leucobacter sp.]|nr:TetR family transcriptional regulator [Leucobacter sp.]
MAKKAAGGTKRVQRDPNATRQALLSSAVALFEEYGYDVTSVQQIVDRAERTKGAFYHYFDSKEDLLHDIHDGFIDVQLELAREVMGRDIPTDEKLRRFIVEVMMEPIGRYKSEITIYLHEQRFIDQESFGQIRAKRDEFANYLFDLVAQGVEEGVFRDLGPTRIVAFGIIGMAAWSHTWMTMSGPLSPREIGEVFATMILDGLAA